jgi:hypothetical protein
MLYVPADVYVWEGLINTEVPPSPKFQMELVGTGTEVFVNVTVELMQTLAGILKEVVMPPITTGTADRSVSLQPPELVVTNVTG